MEYLFSSAYLPPIAYFVYMLKAHREQKTIYIEANENYIKQTFRNRAYIPSNNGLQILSIPVKSNSGDKIQTKDIIISEHGNWRATHINAIKTAYGSSPFFEFYKDDIFDIINTRQKSLWQLNIDLLSTLLELMHINIDFDITKEFKGIDNNTNDYRFTLSPKVNFTDNNILKLKYYDTLNNRQSSWLSQLSIIDLLFNMGTESILILENAITNNEEKELI